MRVEILLEVINRPKIRKDIRKVEIKITTITTKIVIRQKKVINRKNLKFLEYKKIR